MSAIFILKILGHQIENVIAATCLWNGTHFAHDICLTLICIDYLGNYCTPAVPYIMESMGLQVCGELSSLTSCGLTSCCTFAVKLKIQVSKTGGFLNLPVFFLLPVGKICWALHAQDTV